ncbi:MAG: alpha-amylase family glycosyl hydrolase [Acidobacteriota bacterium]|nr:alpha-amylase family glycosyl hydrolase [Acidobacteriota bacterium]
MSKVEPPNWWVGLAHDPMLLLTGENLQQARVISGTPGVTVWRVQAGAEGRYLFAWLRIARNTQPGKALLTVHTTTGETQVVLPLEKRERVAETGKGVHADDVLYLIMPDRFADAGSDPAKSRNHVDRADPRVYHGGDLNGVTQHLGYLKDLGVTAIWLTPWWKNDANAADYHGYHVTDFYAVDDHFGSLDDLRTMVSAAHRLGIKVVSDYVANHTGPAHPWVQHPPTATWWHGSPQHHLDAQYNFWPLLDPHSTLHDRRPVLEGWFAGKLPDINPDDPLLEEYLADNAIWWMESAHFDGYRLDTFPYSSRASWGKWHQALRTVYPQVTSVGEVADESPVVTSFYEGGRKTQGIDSGATTVFDFPFFHRLRGVLNHNEPVTKLANVFEHDLLYQHPEGLYTFLGNHDQKRLLSDDNATPEKLKAAFSLLLTVRGIPGIYYGDEIAMRGGDDPDNRQDFPGGFAGDAHDAFTAAGRTAEEQAMFLHVQRLVHLHREHPALQKGSMTLLEANETSMVYLREEPGDRVLVVFNAAPKEQTITLPRAETPLQELTAAEPLVDAASASISAEQVTVPVAPMTVSIYRLR